MFGHVSHRDPDQQSHSEHRHSILDRAEKVHGGQTTAWRCAQQIKKVCQKYDVGDLVTIFTERGGLRVVMSRDVPKRLGTQGRSMLGQNRHYQLINDLIEAVRDCGYDLAVGDDYFEVRKI